MTGIFHIVLARKPLEGTIAENCLQWGCGALWIDGTRVGKEEIKIHGYKGDSYSQSYKEKGTQPVIDEYRTAQGRFPANLILGGEEVVGLFPQTTSGFLNQSSVKAENRIYGKHTGYANPITYAPDSGSAARFFFNFSEQEADE